MPYYTYIGIFLFRMCAITYLRTIRPWLRPNLIFNLTKHGRDQAAALRVLHGFTKDIIDKRIKQRDEEGPMKEEDLSKEIGMARLTRSKRIPVGSDRFLEGCKLSGIAKMQKIRMVSQYH